MVIVKIYAILIIFVASFKCTRVIDKYIRTGINVEQYCPKIGDCPEGTHVLCMYYIPRRKLGPRCSYAKNVTMKRGFSERILEIVNGIRSKISRGQEKDKNGNNLPRGYGIIKLEWDEELATFAQLWADQCTLGWDKCRATKKFSNPGQVAGINSFKTDDWIPLFRNFTFTKPGFTKEKVYYAIYHTIQSFYTETKSMLTAELIRNQDTTNEAQWILDKNSLMQFFYGPSTHIGCGISAYKRFTYTTSYDPIINCVRLVCNFSHRAVLGEPIYDLKPKRDTGYTYNCGCPPDYDEEEGTCLCVRNREKRCINGHCSSNVVILPIFTVQDAPLEKIHSDNRKSFGNLKYNPENEVNLLSNTSSKHTESFPEVDDYNELRNNMYVKSNHYPKASLFSKPIEHDTPFSSNKLRKNIRLRKDFSNLNTVVDEYFEGKRNKTSKLPHKFRNEPESRLNNKNTFDTDQQIDHGRFAMKNVNLNNTNNEFTLLTDEKILLLLYKLEKELKNFDLSINERKEIDEKVQNIYGVLLQKTNMLKTKSNNINQKNIKSYHCIHNEPIENYDNYRDIDQGIVTKEGRDSYKRDYLRKSDVTNDYNPQNNDYKNKNYKINHRTEFPQLPKFRKTYEIRRDVNVRNYNEHNNYGDVQNPKSKSEFLGTLGMLEKRLQNEQNQEYYMPSRNYHSMGSTEIGEGVFEQRRSKKFYGFDGPESFVV